MLLGFRAGVDQAAGITKSDQFAATRTAWKLGPGQAPIGRVFPAGPAPGNPVFTPGDTTPGQLVARLDAAARPVLDAGMWPCLSVKPDVAATLSGAMLPHFTAAGKWAAGLGVPCYFSVWHEPENDSMIPGVVKDHTDHMRRATNFVTVHTAAYRAMKAAAGDKLRMGPCHMGYQWRPGSPTTSDGPVAAGWRVPSDCRDFIGVDSYTSNWSWPSAQSGQTLAMKTDFQRWVRALEVPPSEILVVERGVSRTYAGMSDPGQGQAVTLRADYDYLKGVGAHGLMWWNSGGATDDSVFLLGAAGRAVFAQCAADAAVIVASAGYDRYDAGYVNGRADGLAAGIAAGARGAYDDVATWAAGQMNAVTAPAA